MKVKMDVRNYMPFWCLCCVHCVVPSSSVFFDVTCRKCLGTTDWVRACATTMTARSAWSTNPSAMDATRCLWRTMAMPSEVSWKSKVFKYAKWPSKWLTNELLVSDLMKKKKKEKKEEDFVCLIGFLIDFIFCRLLRKWRQSGESVRLPC